MKMFEFRIQFDWSLFLRVQMTILQHWMFIGIEQATSHYLNQWWPSSLIHICITQTQWVETWSVFSNLFNSQQTSHSLPFGSKFGISCAKSRSDLYVIALLLMCFSQHHVILCNDIMDPLGPLLLTAINWTSIWIREWISNYTHN